MGCRQTETKEVLEAFDPPGSGEEVTTAPRAQSQDRRQAVRAARPGEEGKGAGPVLRKRATWSLSSVSPQGRTVWHTGRHAGEGPLGGGDPLCQRKELTERRRENEGLGWAEATREGRG